MYISAYTFILVTCNVSEGWNQEEGKADKTKPAALLMTSYAIPTLLLIFCRWYGRWRRYQSTSRSRAYYPTLRRFNVRLGAEE